MGGLRQVIGLSQVPAGVVVVLSFLGVGLTSSEDCIHPTVGPPVIGLSILGGVG